MTSQVCKSTLVKLLYSYKNSMNKNIKVRLLTPEFPCLFFSDWIFFYVFFHGQTRQRDNQPPSNRSAACLGQNDWHLLCLYCNYKFLSCSLSCQQLFCTIKIEQWSLVTSLRTIFCTLQGTFVANVPFSAETVPLFYCVYKGNTQNKLVSRIYLSIQSSKNHSTLHIKKKW